MTKYWFRQKKFGYGATPNCWQGWLVIIASALATVAVIIAADFQRDDATRFLLVAIGLPLIVVPTVLITHAKTEGGWRWVRSASLGVNEMVRRQRQPRATTISSDERREP